MGNFKKIRIETRKHWLTQTKRKRYINDITDNALECDWQRNYVSQMDKHNSIYCSIAEWNSHITDLLSDVTYDNYNFNQEKYNKALFRYYTRTLLIASEILTDFEDFVKYLKGVSKDDARRMLSNPNLPFSVQELMDYINNICKHKIGHISQNMTPFKYHCHNHHVDYIFLDSGTKSNETTLSIKNLRVLNTTYKVPIEVIKLKNIIESILNGYAVIDGILKNDFSILKTKLIQFEE